jgi:hypothetical protein
MKPEHLYQQLKELAEKLNITVSEKNFRNAGINVTSGLCKVKGRQLFIMDKHLPVHRKNKILAACLRTMPHESVYVMPAVREIIDNQ